MLIGDMYAPGKVRMIEVPEPVLPPQPPVGCSGQIVFQPETTCLCGSDLPYFNGWNEWPIELGHSLHEMIGTVTATNGNKWKVGDRVLAVPVKQQGLSERFILDENRAITVATNIPEEQALMAQPLGTVLFALRKIPSVLDRDVAVVGQGPMGQLFNAVLKNLGARQVIGIDLVKSRLATSPKMGATATICNATCDPVSEVRKILGENYRTSSLSALVMRISNSICALICADPPDRFSFSAFHLNQSTVCAGVTCSSRT